MPLKTLHLDPLHLTYPAEMVGLSITSTAEFRLPSEMRPSLDETDITSALKSGILWVGNDKACRVDIKISFNNRPLDGVTRARVLEPLGHHILGANLWSQLSLSTSLEMPLSDHLNLSQADLTILLRQASSTTASILQPQRSISDYVDFKAPPCVPCAEFQRLEVRLDFHTLHENSPPAQKRVKICEQTPKLMIDRLENFEEVDDRLTQLLPPLTAEGLKQPDTWDQTIGTKLLDEVTFPFSEQLRESKPPASPLPFTENRNDTTKRKENGPFPKGVTDTLKAWLDMHSKNPYPTNEEKQRLMNETGLRRSQLTRWFVKARRRLHQSLSPRHNEDRMLLEQIEGWDQPIEKAIPLAEEYMLLSSVDDILPPRIWRPPDHRDMIFSEDSEIPSLTSQSSMEPSTMSIGPSFSQKRLFLSSPGSPGDTGRPELSKLCSNELTSAGFGILIGGCRSKRFLRSITFEKEFPNLPLSRLIPSIFCPGFNELMAHNSRFLPTISYAMASSWVGNCQGPGLRAKLLELENVALPELDDGLLVRSGEPRLVERLSVVVQVRLWSMMHMKLSDPAITGRFQRTSFETGAKEDEQYPSDELLRRLGEEEVPGVEQKVDRDPKEYIGSQYMEDDEELLFIDPLVEDNELLAYFDEMEKLDVEKQTDEMLFGSEEPEDEDVSDIILLDGENEEIMLL